MLENVSYVKFYVQKDRMTTLLFGAPVSLVWMLAVNFGIISKKWSQRWWTSLQINEICFIIF